VSRKPHRKSGLAAALALSLVATWPTGAIADPRGPVPALGPIDAYPTGSGRPPEGRPTVVLDHLTVPDVPDRAQLERHLRRILRREAERVDWGAGKGSRIEYRFTVEKLERVDRGDGVLHLKCEAMGRLPRGKSARSKLAIGAASKDRKKASEHVLEIVARGVLTRLAELERARRRSASGDS
jgi:hypothetical protein